MSGLGKFLDTKHGKFIGRVYMLAVLFVANALMAIGSSMYFMKGKSPVMMVIGVLVTVVSIFILSTPVSDEVVNNTPQDE